MSSTTSAVPTLKPSPMAPRKYNFKIGDLLVKTAGTIAMKTVEHVSFRSAKYKYDRLGRIMLDVVTVTRIPGENQRLHRMQWYARDHNYSGPLYKCPAIMFSCDCKYWLYFCEYAWWSKGLAEIIYSNGEYPVTTNPGRRIYCCKHGLRSGLTMISKRL